MLFINLMRPIDSDIADKILEIEKDLNSPQNP
jgi:hypothetical protein